MRGFLKFVVRVTVLVVALYYVGVNGFLSSPLADKVMTMTPHIAQIHYGQAYSLVPFRVVIDDLRLSVQDPNIQLYVSADHAEADIYPWSFLHNRFYATNVKGDGVVFRIRERVQPGQVK